LQVDGNFDDQVAVGDHHVRIALRLVDASPS
jgi:hypothetical protein